MDYIIRAMSRDGFVKAMAIRSTGLVERARQIHKTTPTATASSTGTSSPRTSCCWTTASCG